MALPKKCVVNIVPCDNGDITRREPFTDTNDWNIKQCMDNIKNRNFYQIYLL